MRAGSTVHVGLLLGWAMGFMVPPSFAAPENSPIHLRAIIERYREQFLDAPATKAAVDKAQRLIRSQAPDGSWPEATLEDGNLAPTHLRHVEELCRLYSNENSPLHGDAGALRSILAGLDAWLATRPQHPNWWNNEIGNPRAMRSILILLGADLDDARRAGAMEILAQHRVRGTGANLTWSADLALHQAALTGDDATVAKMAARIAAEIQVGEPEGIQTDQSFFQHGSRLQQFHYGGAFYSDNARIAWQLRETPWAFDQRTLSILRRYLVDGSRWMQRNGYTVPSTLDRAVSRRGHLKISPHHPIRMLAAVDLDHTAEYTQILQELSGKAVPPTGFRHFPVADFTAYHRPGFSFFLKTRSDRTPGTEVGLNGENLKGHLLGSGDTYFMAEGNEYFDLMPLWDWSRIPGVTAFADATAPIGQPFTGGVGNGESGFVATDYSIALARNQSALLTGRKAWFAHGDRVVCLVGGLKVTDPSLPVETAIDQARGQGDVTVASTDTVATLQGSGEHRQVRWIHHGPFVYLFPQGEAVQLLNEQVTGRWRSINRQQSDAVVHEAVFNPVVQHAADGSDRAPLAYIVAPASSADDARAIAQNVGVEVLRNDASVQAVRFADGTVMAAFYRPGTLGGIQDPVITVDRPCLVLLRAGIAWVSDPTQQGGPLTLTLNAGPALSLNLPPGGISTRN